MTRYIDADALMESLEEMRDSWERDKIRGNDYACGMYDGYYRAIDKVDDAPTIEPDRPHGEWIDKNYVDLHAFATCSECGVREEQEYNESPNATEDTMVICKPFCPNCGADMRGGEK